MKNEALHRQTVRPNSVINKNSRNLGEKEGGYFCLLCVRMDGHDYRLPFEVCSASCVLWYRANGCFGKRKAFVCLCMGSLSCRMILSLV